MIVNPSLPSGFVIFCDDIRHEISGKSTYVGVYSGQMVLTGNLPVTLPQLYAAITFRVSPPSEIIKPVIKVHMSGQDEALFEWNAEIEPVINQQDNIAPIENSDSITVMQIGITAGFQGLIISEPCQIRVRAYIGDDEYRLGILQIVLASQIAVGEQP